MYSEAPVAQQAAIATISLPLLINIRGTQNAQEPHKTSINSIDSLFGADRP
jgi:hypothetical protein